MNKKLMIFLTVVLAFSLVVVGCGGGGDTTAEPSDPGDTQQPADPAPAPSAPSPGDLNLLMATGGTGGTYYPLGGSMANVWNRNIDGMNVTVQATGASVENLRLLASGEAELIMSMNGPATAAFEGTGAFEGNALDFRAAGVIYPEVMQVIAPVGTGIKSIEDLVGKRVSIGPPGSGTATSAEAILEAFGIDPDNDIRKFQDNFTDAARKLKDGELDAAFAVLAVPAANVIDITTATDVNVVNIQGEGLDRLLEMDPTFSPFEIPANTYDGQTETGYTVSQWAVLYVPTDMDEQVVYDLTRVMYERQPEIATGHARGDQISLDNAMLGIDPVPFHPGALRYFQEVGLAN
ncbi:TAXI family TRAP transporter solute-binding subunit [Desulfuribacillus alkaliarsenatis]|uniref:TAXI family TRAP transporter solute-binding subunit n=1 Tax=Desulfuribacillus alkaliarsenatis TaxID=766136 RepID=UPI000AB18CFC|nr:TAXI family TRAP transporter solute-binding subunit [Desulfuribacillus alkaliarsenatis]